MDKGTLMPYEGLILDYNQDGWNSICIETHLGGGAYGDVFYGVEADSGREVTVKIIRNVDGGLEEYRVKNEAAVDIDSEHIVPVLSCQQWNATTWVILFKNFKAESLDDVIEKYAGEGVPHSKEYTRQLILALHAAHQTNILHRDIKPANILISDHSDDHPGILRVIDFGVSKFRAGENLTISGAPIGTKPYMCPYIEIKGGKDADFTADIFSFGITVTEMVLGKHPWRLEHSSIANNVKHQMEIGQDTMVDSTLFDENPELSLFKDLVVNCTKLDPGHRLKQWGDVAKTIGLALDLEPVGEIEFSGKGILLNTSGINDGGLIPIDLSENESITIGRDRISVTNTRISREHFILLREDGKLLVADLGSKNGTWLDGEKLEPENPKEATNGSKLRCEDIFIEIEFTP
jgi:serine/threonine protein kinase